MGHPVTAVRGLTQCDRFMIKSTDLVMNTEQGTTPSSRWVREVTGDAGAASDAERQVLSEVLKALRRVRHGAVTLSVQDGRVVQLDVTEKRRF